MIPITHRLILEDTITLQEGEEAFVQIRGFVSSCLLSLKFLTAGAAAIIQSTIASGELFDDQSAAKADFLWEDIKVSGVSYPEVTFEIPSLSFAAPAVLYIKNTSAGGQAIRIHLRGNH